MHFCIAIITKDFPTDEVLRKKLAPYYEEDYWSNSTEEKERPLFMWDWWVVGGRYGGLIKLKIDKNNKEYEWGVYAKTPRAGRLYRSFMCESKFNKETFDWLPEAEEDYYSYLGYREGYIRVDGCKIKDILDFDKGLPESRWGWGFIGKDDEAYARNYYDNASKKYVDNDLYEEQVKAAVQDVQDCYLTFVDIHE